jgi:hypothetical protein
MAASPERVWSLVSDITRTGQFSPETFEAEWLDGASASAVGVRFRGHVRRNGRAWLVYWSTCTITASVPSREFTFQVDGRKGEPLVSWSYYLGPSGDGTNVTESFELPPSFAVRIYERIAGTARTRTNLNNMRATLERIKEVAESTDRGVATG